MNKIKLLGIVSISLFLLNLVLIWYIIEHKPRHSRRNEPKKVIIEKLQFNTGQIEAYEKLIDSHRTKMFRTEQNMKQLKKQLYANLQEGHQYNNSDSLMKVIGEVQIEIEKIHYYHFEDIKQLCTPEQKPFFNQLSAEMAELFAPKRMPPHDKK